MSQQPLGEAFKHAADGIIYPLLHERNFKIEVGFGIAAVILGLFFSIDLTQWAVIAVCVGLVLSGECVNTSLEAVVDLASPEYHELAKRAKDCAAGGVLISSFASLFVAAFIFLPKIIDFIL